MPFVMVSGEFAAPAGVAFALCTRPAAEATEVARMAEAANDFLRCELRMCDSWHLVFKALTHARTQSAGRG
ncbi:hypothetical protein GCM10009839_16140 [Catenulispora yoronensis]|uniref:Uncharacterized protein n=1 Tax=Catenulispora yoronensis TaxID=450799 RepID=A0ABN2TT17_9ACTN